MIDISALTMTEIIRLQNQLQQELTRRFEHPMLLMFSDIVGSTPYFARFGDAAGRQLQQLHFDLLGKCLAAGRGRIVDTSGDGVFAVYASADAAVQAVIAFHRLMEQENAGRAPAHALQVRVGLHWSPVLTDGEAVSGDAVNLCARVAASAQSGEIRLTREVFQELAPARRLDCHLIGEVTLKGVARPVELLVLDWRDQTKFPRRLRIDETHEEIDLPQHDIVSFGRLSEHDGTRANDIVLSHPDAALSRQISRWHFQLHRDLNGLRVRALADGTTEVDGQRLAKGEEVGVSAGSTIRVAAVLTLHLVGPAYASASHDPESTMLAPTALRAAPASGR